MSPARPGDGCEAWRPYRLATIPAADLDSRVHVWRLRLDAFAEAAEAALSEDERERAARIARPEDRQRFVACRATLRTILADILDLADLPDLPRGRRLRFGYGPAGKPQLLDDPLLRFNLSHAEDLAVIAVTRAGDVGIDVERQRPLRDMDSVARRAFTDAEQAALLGCPPADRAAVFYRIWTRKEALLKAMGNGLPALHDPRAAALAPGGAAFLVTALPHLDDHVAALARPRSAHGLRLWSWPTANGMRATERRARPRVRPAASSPIPFRFEARP